MTTIEITYNDPDECIQFEVGSGIESDIIAFANGRKWTITSFDDDYPDPRNFDNLNEYAEIVGKINEYGEAYRLRYDDVGDFDFEDEYNGCWEDEDDFAREIIDECHDIPDFMQCYIDWENWARDIMMDYSSYEGTAGTHIFRN